MLINAGIDPTTFNEIIFYQEVFLRVSMKITGKPAGFDTQITRWFGVAADGDAIIERLKRFRSVANSIQLTVMQKPLSQRKIGVLGSATRPGVRKDYSLTEAAHDIAIQTDGTAKKFTYKINSALIKKEGSNTEGDPNNWGQSGFANYVHEISHAFLGTHDVRVSGKNLYGASPHIEWVANGGGGGTDRYNGSGPWGPVDCASCWGFFIEDAIDTAGRIRLNNAVSNSRTASIWSKPPMPSAADIVK